MIIVYYSILCYSRLNMLCYGIPPCGAPPPTPPALDPAAVALHVLGHVGVRPDHLAEEDLGWHYLSHAACLIRPRLFSAA